MEEFVGVHPKLRAVMITFLFWNLNGRPIQSLVVELVQRHDVDLLLLAECAIPATDLLTELNRGQVRLFTAPDGASLCDRIVIFPRFPANCIERVVETRQVSFRQIHAPGKPSFLLGGVHLASKQFQSTESQSQAATGLRHLILQAEQQVRHRRRLVVGDWNMNPFEAGMVSAAGLHAVMTRALAAQESRSIDGVPYFFFYNPMWGRLGDTTAGPPGSYYYRSNEHVSYFWHLFDQLLLRPALLPFFGDQDLSVLDRAGARSLMSSNGLPDRRVGSDHLPLLFRLRL